MATTEINIVARNRAAAALRQVNTQLGAIQGATQNVNAGMGRLRNLVLGVAAALGGIRVAKGFLDTAVEVENLGVQLKFITGSAQEGAKALDIVTEAAAKSSFQLRDMAQAAPLLLTVADSTDELNNLLSITGDIAAASGLSFVETAGQLQRAFSGGIAAADLFRGRGVKALLGFEEGVRYNAEQTKDIITTAFRDGTVTIAGASADMASTFTGQISMIQDKVFQFQKQVMDAAPFEFLKAIVTVVNTEIENRFGSIEEAAQVMGQNIVNSVRSVTIGFGRFLDALSPVLSFVRNAINGFLSMIDQLPAPLQALGIIGFLMLGVKGKLIVAAISLVVNKIKDIFKGVINVITNTARKVGDFADAVGFDGMAADIRKFADNMDARLDEMAVNVEDFVHNIDGLAADTMPQIAEFFGLPAPEDMGPYEQQLRSFFDKVDLQIQEFKKKAQAQGLELPTTEGPKDPNAGTSQKQIEDQKKRTNELLKALGQRVEGHIDALKTEREAEIDSHNARIKDLRQFINMNTELRRYGNEQIRREEERHQKAMAAIQRAEFNEQLDLFKQGEFAKMDLSKVSQEDQVDFVKSAGREILSVMATQNRKAFELQKRLQIAQAIMNVATGVTKALAQGGIFGPIMAAAIVGLGAAQIAAIQSQQYQGRRFGGTVNSRQPYIVGEAGPELFVPGQVGTVQPDAGMGGGPVNVNFSITATDARSVDELLVERRGMITNMVRQAIQERGNKPNF